ncbi:sulfite reductase subunit alpha [Marinifilum sp. N1E240]|uniref:diflavin oxidoreductase n=1 Tax=Marinifilum sp. N1E240 TaxID=2608082 RepID=UPI00128C4E4D|nr:sulfite reductase flavoprotein subunit alpha [Marinifilum sp. N1E240]MPQ46867.1 sulfite reductase subunit alpha [Marinifilum sp. N1E240]
MKDILYIIYGSRTGNSRSIAELTNRYAKQVALKTCLLEMKSMEFQLLDKIHNMLLIVSTHGEGDPPAVAMEFYNYLHDKKRKDLKQLNFSVLALGDSSYKDYCKTGKDLEKRLLQLGSKKILPVQECDVDFEEVARDWIKKAVEAHFHLIQADKQFPSTDFSFDFYVDSQNTKGEFQVRVKEKRNLCGSDSTKKTIHLAFSLEGVNKQYKPGDSLAIQCTNSRFLVDRLLRKLKFDGTHAIQNNGSIELLKESLIKHYELSLLTPVVLKKYASIANIEALNRIIASSKAIEEYCFNHDVLDMVSDFPVVIKPEQFLTVLRKLKPRLYSVASSYNVYPDEVHITLGVMEYNLKDRSHIGITSSYLSDRIEVGEMISVYIENNDSFRLPENTDLPIIMIGCGTGIAAYRSFLQERAATKSKGDNWLIFGERNSKTDFIYQDELVRYLESGILTSLETAFSRDQAEKIYVQDIILKQSVEIYNWMENRNATVYICGNKRTMAISIRKALMKVIAKEGKLSKEEVKNYVSKLKSEKRWQEDVY